MTMLYYAIQIVLLYVLPHVAVSLQCHFTSRLFISSPCSTSKLNSKAWGIGDNWDELWSTENDTPIIELSNENFYDDRKKWGSLESSSSYEPTSEELLIEDAVDAIHQNQNPSDPPLYDTASSFETFLDSEEFLDEAGREISMLVRCNESPEALLIDQGRKLKPLSDSERYDATLLVTLNHSKCNGDDSPQLCQHYTSTTFFNNSVDKMFHKYARPPKVTKETNKSLVVLDAQGISSWMSTCLDDNVGSHNKRVRAVISRYGTYGTGYLSSSEFHQLYLDAVLSGLKSQTDAQYFGAKRSAYGRVKLNEPDISSVWRDLKKHGIFSPAEQEYNAKKAEIDSKLQRDAHRKDTDIFDECEILDWGSLGSGVSSGGIPQKKRDTSEKVPVERSSHKLVELANDNKTPNRLRDGEFVFIDEDSCIGCTQCAMTAPSVFKMLDNGRARTFSQSNNPEVAQAINVCPVSCMHKVAFHELTEMESARDEGDGRTDHRHMGSKVTPLHVSLISSDVNHKSSWFHYLKQKCYTSKSCPQRGCYSCPLYTEKGANPYFKRIHREAEHIRALSFIESGEANKHRRFVEL